MAKRIVFMGSPEFAVPTLDALANHYPITGVVTQPDRPAGRGRKLTPPPVKILAEQLDLQTIQPKSLGEQSVLDTLVAWKPDLIVVTAFGQILREEVLDLPPFGSLNVHASLLPRWRGAAPIQAAILHGDEFTGVTIMKMDQGIDTGPLLRQQELAIQPDETAGSLSPKLSQMGADLLIETLPGYFDGDLHPQPQQGEHTYAPMLKKRDGQLDFTKSAEQLERQIRAYNPWPGSFMNWENGQIKVHQARVLKVSAGQVEGQPGQRTISGEHPAILTNDGILVLEVLQPAGKKPMPGPVFLHGAREWI